MMESSVLSGSSAGASDAASASNDNGNSSNNNTNDNNTSQSQSHSSCHLENGEDSFFEVTADRSLADADADADADAAAADAIMGDHELPLMVDKGCETLRQFDRSTGQAVVIDPANADDDFDGRESSSSLLAAGADDDAGRGGGTGLLVPAEGSGGFDVCREYGYRYEYTEEDEDEDDGYGYGDGDDNEDGHGSGHDRQRQQQRQRQRIIDHDDDPLYTAHVVTGGVGASATAGDGGRTPRPIPDWSSSTIISNANSSGNTGSSNDDSAQPFGGTSYLLGRSYHPVHDFATRRDDESSLLWMTYRRDFPIINPYGITSDAGWGCMLRSAQMMLCQALRVHHVGREWRPPKSFARRRQDEFARNVLTWFADYPSADGRMICKYSLHNMVAAGFKYEMLPGEWYGPQTACHVIKDLCEMHSKVVDGYVAEENREERDTSEEGKKKPSDASLPMLRVHVAQEGSVYRDAVDELMTRDAKKKRGRDTTADKDKMALTESSTPSSLGSSGAFEDPLLNNPLSAAADLSKAEPVLEWDTSLLLLVPLRLGLKSFNADTYRLPLAHTFALRQSVGFLGGTPRHALWFYGASSDGAKVYGLDPHTTQDTPSRRRPPTPATSSGEDAGSNNASFEIVLSDEYLRSVHCTHPSTMEMSRIDPSLALAFYCRNRADFDDLCAALEDMKAEGKKHKIPELFCVADAAPDYCANVSSALVDMMMSSSTGNIGGFDDDFADNGHASDSDDEEYVML
eukprot:CAMPEP_0178478276 /NCGR_PEP_ID=MMETSP0696-20121128/4576_1 /TAXON_ID=265572 /ORGANISM="Extubocellulus spinifer, Strain CCMP396" /LENGTH=741 /DNA_ID=CAMNT_0020105639 /DNA_START=46 /DNA_END=2271 /DNA_ORIENTATION=+